MSIFGKIKDAIFGHKTATVPTAQVPEGGARSNSPAATQPSATIDVEQVLANIAVSRDNPGLNYKTSIVDLMKLLSMDSSLENRKELATELGYTGPKDGSAEMNIWLHAEVMRQLAAHGGRVPASMMD